MYDSMRGKEKEEESRTGSKKGRERSEQNDYTVSELQVIDVRRERKERKKERNQGRTTASTTRGRDGKRSDGNRDAKRERRAESEWRERSERQKKVDTSERLTCHSRRQQEQ